VKAIRDLGRGWSTFGRTAGVVLGPVTGNDFDPRMIAQPRGDDLGRAFRQEFDRPTLFKIHQDRAIDPALAEGKIIDAQDPGLGLGGCRRATENPPDRLATEGHPQASGHPGASFTAGLASEDADGLGQPPGTLRVPGGKRWEAFGKGPARTRGRETAETPDGQAEAHRMLRDGEIA
jgi:hypothetical protein